MIGKRHGNLVRDIDKYVNDIDQNSKLSSDNFFISSTYQSGTGKNYKCYLLTKQGCEFVANKMTGKKGNQFTAQYVSLFNSMKNTIENSPQAILDKLHKDWGIPTTLSGALQLAANQQKQLEEQKTKVDYYDSQMHNPGLMTTTEIAKDFGMSAVKLNKYLAKKKVIYRQGGHWVFYQAYSAKGYGQYEVFPFNKKDSKVFIITLNGRKKDESLSMIS